MLVPPIFVVLFLILAGSIGLGGGFVNHCVASAIFGGNSIKY